MWIIKPGFFMRKRPGLKQPGLDLGRVAGDWLVSMGLVSTTDCCVYNPLVKTLADADAPNNSIYYSTDQTALVYKDADGVISTITVTPV